MSKNLTVIIPGTNGQQEPRDLTLDPGTTPRDILRGLNIGDNYVVSRYGGEIFGPTEVIYDKVETGEKLSVTPQTTVGALLSGLIEFLRLLFGGSSPADSGQSRANKARREPRARAQASKVRPRVDVTNAPIRGVHIKPDTRPLWQQRLWTREGDTFKGAYRTKIGAIDGLVTQRGRTRFDFYVISPPRTLLTGPHGACFHKRPKSKIQDLYWVHFNAGSEPRDVDSGIVAVEALLREALQELRTSDQIPTRIKRSNS